MGEPLSNVVNCQVMFLFFVNIQCDWICSSFHFLLCFIYGHKCLNDSELKPDRILILMEILVHAWTVLNLLINN